MYTYSQMARDDRDSLRSIFGECRITADGSELITYTVEEFSFVRHVGGRLHLVLNGGDYNADTPQDLADILERAYKRKSIHPDAQELVINMIMIRSGLPQPSALPVSSSGGAGSSSGGSRQKRKPHFNLEDDGEEDFEEEEEEEEEAEPTSVGIRPTPTFVNDGEVDEDGGRFREADNGDVFYETEAGLLVHVDVIDVEGVGYTEVLGKFKLIGPLSDRVRERVDHLAKRRKTDGGDGGFGH